MATTQERFRHLFTLPPAAVLERRWGWLLALGIVFAVLGALGLSMVVLLTLASILWIGILALVGGVVQIVQAFSFREWKGRLAHLAIGVLYGFAGWVIISDPLVASVFFTAMLGWALVAIGIFRMIVAAENRVRGVWAWHLVGGILTIALGTLILLQWPASGIYVIGLIVAVELIIHGWTYIALALAVKRS